MLVSGLCWRLNHSLSQSLRQSVSQSANRANLLRHETKSVCQSRFVVQWLSVVCWFSGCRRQNFLSNEDFVFSGIFFALIVGVLLRWLCNLKVRSALGPNEGEWGRWGRRASFTFSQIANFKLYNSVSFCLYSISTPLSICLTECRSSVNPIHWEWRMRKWISEWVNE